MGQNLRPDFAVFLACGWLTALIVIAFFVLAGTKDLSPAHSVAALVSLGLSYLRESRCPAA